MAEAPTKLWRQSSWRWPAIRLGISAGILGVLVTQLNARHIGDTMLQVGPLAVVLGAAFVFAISVPMARRWQIVIAADGQHLSFSDVWSSTLIGMFFNQVLPTSIGGDVVRGIYAHFCGISRAGAAKSVFIDRTIGLLVLLLSVIPGVVYLFLRRGELWVVASLSTIIAVGLVGFAVLCCLDKLPLPQSLLAPGAGGWRFQLARAGRTLVAISPQIRTLLFEARNLLPVLALSLFVQYGLFLVVIGFARSLDVPASVGELLSVVPAAMLLGNIPISVAGWGVREGAMIGVTALVGVNAQQALTISLLFGIAQLLASLPGGIVWWRFDRTLRSGDKAKP